MVQITKAYFLLMWVDSSSVHWPPETQADRRSPALGFHHPRQGDRTWQISPWSQKLLPRNILHHFWMHCVGQSRPHGQAWGLLSTLIPGKDLHPRILSLGKFPLTCEGKRKILRVHFPNSLLSPASFIWRKDSREDPNLKIKKTEQSPRNEERWKGKDITVSNGTRYVVN